MRGFKTDIHTVREVANARQSWDYAPAWLAPDGTWCLPEATEADLNYRYISHASFQVGRTGDGYERNWSRGYARVAFPKDGKELAVEKGFTPRRRRHRTLTAAQKAAIAEAIHLSTPSRVTIPGVGTANWDTALEHLT